MSQMAFYMVGDINEVSEKADKVSAASKSKFFCPCLSYVCKRNLHNYYAWKSRMSLHMSLMTCVSKRLRV